MTVWSVNRQIEMMGADLHDRPARRSDDPGDEKAYYADKAYDSAGLRAKLCR